MMGLFGRVEELLNIPLALQVIPGDQQVLDGIETQDMLERKGVIELDYPVEGEVQDRISVPFVVRVLIRVNIVSLDFPALIERISRTYSYEACLLGLVNMDPDPNGQMNVWLSSAANHQWNPRQKSPETPWEAEIDRLMRAQAASLEFEKRRASFNRVQELVSEQVPFIYLVTKNTLLAVDPRVQNLVPSPLIAQLLGNVNQLTLSGTQTAVR
jgi:ABC-type transport system substrate-binding protein